MRHPILAATAAVGLLVVGLVMASPNRQVRTITDDINPTQDLAESFCSIFDDSDPVGRLTRDFQDGPDPTRRLGSALCAMMQPYLTRSPTSCVETAEACGIQGTLSCSQHGGFISLTWNEDVRYGACVATCQDGTTLSTDQCVTDPNLACLDAGEQGPCPTDMNAGTGRPSPKERADQR